MHRLPTLLCASLWLALGATVLSQPVDLLASKASSTIESQRLALDRERLAFERQKYERDSILEQRKMWATVASVFVPFSLGVLAYWAQALAQRKQERLQFQLKAAELIMDARDTTEVKRKAELLKKLFPERLKDLKLDEKRYPSFSRSQETRLELLKLFAEFPETRGDVLRAWGMLFPWESERSGWSAKEQTEKDEYRWFDELSADKTLSQNRPPRESPQSQRSSNLG